MIEQTFTVTIRSTGGAVRESDLAEVIEQSPDWDLAALGGINVSVKED